MNENENVVSEQPMAPVGAPQVNVEPPKKSSKGVWLTIIVVLIILFAALLVILGPKIVGKNSSNNEPKEQTTVVEQDSNEEEEIPQEEENTTAEEEQMDNNEKDWDDSIPTSKPVDLTGYKLLKTDTQSITLNGKKYELVSKYYQGNDELRKEVYFNSVLVLKNYALVSEVKKNNINNLINEDIDYTKNTYVLINDTKSKDQYLIYYYLEKRPFFETDEYADYATDIRVNVIDKNSEVVYKNRTSWSYGTSALIVPTKEEVLDRKYNTDIYRCNGEDYDPEEDLICDGYVIYGDIYTHNEKYYVGEDVEFFKDHFYSFVYEASDNDYVYDYKYYIENGKLQSKLLKKYEKKKHIISAGAD